MLKNGNINRVTRPAIVLDGLPRGGINHDAVIGHDQAPRGLALWIRAFAAVSEIVVNAAAAAIAPFVD